MSRYDVAGIGNAIVDVIAPGGDDFLARMGIERGIMQLIERDRAETLYSAMSGQREIPGGSVANTIAGVGNLGLRTAFIGRVADDALGRFYVAALAAEGTDFPNPPVRGAGLPTSRSMIFVGADGERSMNTYLGISAEVGPGDPRIRARPRFAPPPRPAGRGAGRRASRCRIPSASTATGPISAP